MRVLPGFGPGGQGGNTMSTGETIRVPSAVIRDRTRFTLNALEAEG
jgi:hypothetical protein